MAKELLKQDLILCRVCGSLLGYRSLLQSVGEKVGVFSSLYYIGAKEFESRQSLFNICCTNCQFFIGLKHVGTRHTGGPLRAPQHLLHP